MDPFAERSLIIKMRLTTFRYDQNPDDYVVFIASGKHDNDISDGVRQQHEDDSKTREEWDKDKKQKIEKQ